MERDVFCEINGEISVLKALKDQHAPDIVWNVYHNDSIVAKLVRSQDFNGLEVWGSRVPTTLTQEQMYWIGIQITAA